MTKRFIPLVLAPALVLAGNKLTDEEKIDIVRGLTAEYATVKSFLPRSKKALPYKSTGEYDRKAWDAAGKEFGPAGRMGDLIQVTKVTLDNDKILLEINNGFKGGRKWYERVEVGMGTSSTPIGRSDVATTAGTSIAIQFDKPLADLKVAQVKKMLAPVLDFEKRSATENYMDTLPEPVKAAIKEKKAIEGMDKEQVLISLGKPVRKSRETVDGMDQEDWVYGQPPGKMTFITFQGSKVIKVKEAYAGLGGAVAPPLPVQ